jgi:hypothetical protein
MFRTVSKQIGDDLAIQHGHTGFFPRNGDRNFTSHIDSFGLQATGLG